MPAATILLLEADASSRDTISAALTTAGYTVNTVNDADEAFRRAAEHQLVILDVVTGPKTAIDVCREIRATPSMAAIPVLCIGQTDEVEERIRFLEVGADDVIARPFDDRELEARIEALLLRFQRSKDLAPILNANGTISTASRRIVAVFSPKGGVGTTTIATNLGMAMAHRHPDRVVVVDMDLQFGQVATHLNVDVKRSLADVARDEAALREPDLLRTYAIRHDAGLHVLAAPPTPELADLISTQHVEAILETILGTYDTVIVDAGSELDDRTMAIFEKADNVILVVNPEMAALKAVHSLLDFLNEAGSVGAKTTFVMNNMFAREILKMRDVESALGTKVSIELPYDPFLYLKAVNEGVPVVVGAPRSSAADRLLKLVELAIGDDSVDGAGRRRRGGLLSGLRRRA
ncbi:MAG TPA: AAA family ATPase [Candidatus Limnocylindrales bacterium]